MVEIAPITIQALPEYRGLDGESADNYYRAGQRRALLSSEIVNPFETALKDSTGYSNGDIPDKEKEVPCDVGDFRFLMKVTPTTKRPGYKEVFDEVNDYLASKKAQYDAGERPAGVYTLDGEPYISAQEVLDVITDGKDRIMSKGAKIEITDAPGIPSGISSMVLPLGMGMSELTEGNTTRYLEACALSERYGEFMSAFEEELLGLTGYDNDNPPGTTEHMFQQLGHHIFHVKSIPYESIGYGKVVAGLDKEPGKRKPENGGDLVLAAQGIEVPRMEAYRPKTRDGDRLIRLNILLERIESLVEENTQTKVRQKPFAHYPIV